MYIVAGLGMGHPQFQWTIYNIHINYILLYLYAHILITEVRVERDENGKCMVYIVNTEAATMKQVIPCDLEDVPLLVLLLDQGSIGAAGVGFTDHLGKLVLVKFEKIHRLIRDIKLALQHCCGGVLLKAQVYSSNLWNYHQKPFGSGHFGTVMDRALNVSVCATLWIRQGFKSTYHQLADNSRCR